MILMIPSHFLLLLLLLYIHTKHSREGINFCDNAVPDRKRESEGERESE